MHPNALLKAMYAAPDDANQTQTHHFLVRSQSVTLFRAQFTTTDFPMADTFVMVQYWLLVNDVSEPGQCRVTCWTGLEWKEEVNGIIKQFIKADIDTKSAIGLDALYKLYPGVRIHE